MVDQHNAIIDEEWRTDEMACAAFLCHNEVELIRLEWELDSCYFVFPNTDEVQELVVEFIGGNGLVEPREYNMDFAKLKRAMFEHPDAPRGRGRRTPRSATA